MICSFCEKEIQEPKKSFMGRRAIICGECVASINSRPERKMPTREEVQEWDRKMHEITQENEKEFCERFDLPLEQSVLGFTVSANGKHLAVCGTPREGMISISLHYFKKLDNVHHSLRLSGIDNETGLHLSWRGGNLELNDKILIEFGMVNKFDKPDFTHPRKMSGFS